MADLTENDVLKGTTLSPRLVTIFCLQTILFGKSFGSNIENIIQSKANFEERDITH